MLTAPTIAYAQPNAAIGASPSAQAGEPARALTGSNPQGSERLTRSDKVDLSSAARSATDEDLTEEQQKQVDELKKRDAEVRRHEEAHQRVGGQYASAPSYEFQQGPDGKNYAVGGTVQIDTAPVEGDPDATIAKMEIVKRAALAPAEPSGQDRAVAAQADATAQAARQEKMDMEGEATEATARGEPTPDATGFGGGPATRTAPSMTLGGYGPAGTSDVGGLLELFA